VRDIDAREAERFDGGLQSDGAPRIRDTCSGSRRPWVHLRKLLSDRFDRTGFMTDQYGPPAMCGEP
jgi:hypothetical protein